MELEYNNYKCVFSIIKVENAVLLRSVHMNPDSKNTTFWFGKPKVCKNIIEGIYILGKMLMESNVKIEKLICCNNNVVMVFYTDAHAWGFRVITLDGSVYGSQGIYYTADAALKVAKKWISE